MLLRNYWVIPKSCAKTLLGLKTLFTILFMIKWLILVSNYQFFSYQRQIFVLIIYKVCLFLWILQLYFQKYPSTFWCTFLSYTNPFVCRNLKTAMLTTTFFVFISVYRSKFFKENNSKLKDPTFNDSMKGWRHQFLRHQMHCLMSETLRSCV